MKILQSISSKRPEQAMTIVEVLIAVMGVAILGVSLYLGMSQGFAIIEAARENLRATQILQEKMETMRVYNWDQINTSGFVPRTFTEPFYAVGTNNTDGFNYTGQVIITNANTVTGVSYNSDLRWVIIQLQWASGDIIRRREMRTLVSQYGLHTYVY